MAKLHARAFAQKNPETLACQSSVEIRRWSQPRREAGSVPFIDRKYISENRCELETAVVTSVEPFGDQACSLGPSLGGVGGPDRSKRILALQAINTAEQFALFNPARDHLDRVRCVALADALDLSSQSLVETEHPLQERLLVASF